MNEKYYKFLGETAASYNEPPVVTYDDIKKELPYLGNFPLKFGVHIGQRKLFLSEVQFLTDLYPAAQYVIYAGAAPSHKGYLLASLFPKMKFILVDPNKFEIFLNGLPHTMMGLDKTGVEYLHSAYYEKYESPPREKWIDIVRESKTSRIFLVEEYFTEELASLFSALENRVFISDIRTNNEDEQPSDIDLLWNSAQQLNWITLLQPMYSMLKFRPPYMEKTKIHKEELTDLQIADFETAKKNGIDFLADYGGTRHFRYFSGTIFVQAWAGKSSSESRLVIPDFRIFKEYDPVEYENKFFYFNCIERGLIHHENPYANRKLGLDHCNDCALEVHIWRNYVQRHTDIGTYLIDIFLKTTEYELHRGLFIGQHGYFFSYNIQELKRRLNYTGIDLGRVKFAQPPQKIKKKKARAAADMNVDSFYNLISRAVPLIQKQMFIDCVKYERNTISPVVRDMFKDIPHSWPYIDNTKIFRIAVSLPDLCAFLVFMDVVSSFSTASSVKYVILPGPHFMQNFIYALPIYFPDLVFLCFDAANSREDRAQTTKYTGKISNYHGDYRYQKVRAEEPGRKLWDFMDDDWLGGGLQNLGLRQGGGGLILFKNRFADVFEDAEFQNKLKKYSARALLYIKTIPDDGPRSPNEIYTYTCFQYNAVNILRPRHYILDLYLLAKLNKTPTNMHLDEESLARDIVVQLAKKNGFDIVELHRETTAAKPEMTFLKGKIYFGPYTFLATSLNFVVGSGFELVKIDAHEYDGRNFYYKTFTRTYALKNNAHADSKIGFDCCNDCAMAAEIIEKYILSRPGSGKKCKTGEVKLILLELLEITGRRLTGDHGHLFTGSDAEMMERARAMKLYHVVDQQKFGGEP